MESAFKESLQRRERVTYHIYRAQRVAFNGQLKVAKKMSDRKLGERLGNDFDGNKKMFSKEVKRARKSERQGIRLKRM